MGSRSTAPHISPPRRLIADADATLVRAQGWASSGELNHPMSRRQVAERRKSSVLPSPRTNAHSVVHQKRDISLDFNKKPEFCRVSAVVSGATAEPLGCRNRESDHNPARSQTGQLADAPRAELIDGNGLFARLVFHRVRPLSQSSVDAGPHSAAPDIGSPLILRSGQRVTLPHVGSLDPEPAPIETLFTELALRRLRSLAPRERP
jgi:hypothetical protein